MEQFPVLHSFGPLWYHLWRTAKRGTHAQFNGNFRIVIPRVKQNYVFNVYIMTVDTTSNMGISSMKIINVNILNYVFNINVSVLHVSTISSGHHQVLMNINQVIKLLVISRIRILAAEGCVVREYMFIY
jgi:hypothetical protein